MHRPLLIGTIGLLLCGAICLFSSLVVMDQLEYRYGQTQNGMTMVEIESLMGSTGLKVHLPEQVSLWEWEWKPMPTKEQIFVKSVIRYHTVRSLFSQTLEFAFDDQQKLVGKRQYD